MRKNVKGAVSAKQNRVAQAWPNLNDCQLEYLKRLTETHGLSVAAGDLQLLDAKWYVTHSGLLGIVNRERCSGIHTEVLTEFSDPASDRWVVKATVFKTARSRGFVGYADANPDNVSPIVRGAELRIAETRAVNRALRKAYGIGLCSVEELGAGAARPSTAPVRPTATTDANEQPRLRDRLLLLIREHQLDAEQVKRYAAQFCGTPSLRDANREQVEAFVNHIAEVAANDLDELKQKLNACAVPAKKPSQTSGTNDAEQEAA